MAAVRRATVTRCSVWPGGIVIATMINVPAAIAAIIPTVAALSRSKMAGDAIISPARMMRAADT